MSKSAAIGLLAGRFAAAERLGETPLLPPPTTAHGALLGHITGGHIETIDAGPRSFQPMNVNFGLFPPLGTNRRGACRPDADGGAGPEEVGQKRAAVRTRAGRPRAPGCAGGRCRMPPSD